MLNLISIFIGGGIGSVLRSIVCSRINSHWGVMVVNISGALLIGFCSEFILLKSGLRPEVKAFLITGFLGGFTTFSTYMLDFGGLLGATRTAEAFLYLLGSLLAGVFFLYIGFWTARSVL